MGKQYKQGFTLIEIMMVLMIMGLILRLSFVTFDSLTPSAQINAGARSIVSALGLAYNRAATTGRPTVIHYNLDKGYYQIVVLSSPISGKRQPLKESYLPDGVYFHDVTVAGMKPQTKGWIEIKISPLGQVPAHIVHLAHKKGGKITIEVNPATGLAHIWEGHQPFRFLEEEE